MIARMAGRVLGAALLMVVSMIALASAGTSGDSKVVGNVLIYVGVLPAPIVRGHPATHSEASMHGGVPSRSDQYHVVIALFDAKSYQRISKAEVSARVSEVGMASENKKLEPMTIADTITYGNYFRMAGRGPFEIALAIKLPGSSEVIKATFEHRHE